MTWSYNSANLATSSRYRVRLFIGDTNSTDEQLQDEEIDYVLTVETSPTLAAAVCCDLLAAKYSRQMNTENGELRISAAARMKHYMDLADRLRKGGAGDVPGDAKVINATMFVGGVSKDGKADLLDNTDNIGTPFRLGSDDHPENDQSVLGVTDED